jgi:hypothetical protein
VATQNPIVPHVYQEHVDDPSLPPRIDSTNVRYWSDYSRVYFHPKSLVKLDDPTNSLARPIWDNGTTIFDQFDANDDVLDDQFRFFLEECDALQGIRVLADVNNAWGGFASGYIEKLRDDLGKTVIEVWGLDQVQDTEESNTLVSL